MSNVIEFRPRARDTEAVEIDIWTAVDAAIRDLRDIAQQCAHEGARELAEECRQMLEQAFNAPVP